MQYSKDIPLQWYEKYLLHAGCLPLLKMNVNIINWIEMSMKKIFYFEKIIISLACLPKIEIKSRMMLKHQCAFLVVRFSHDCNEWSHEAFNAEELTELFGIPYQSILF
jgi:hypothetical protein